MPPDFVLDDLRAVYGDRARPAADSDAVAGVPARYVVAPDSTHETAEALRIADRHDLRVVARGGGTKLGWGVPPTTVDLVVDTSLMSGVVEHAAGDLVVVVRAGTSLQSLQDTLADADQALALDGPIDGATVGGTIATNTSGPRRLLFGTVRDQLIGITFVRADGVVAKAGGKVVKNVAGYDFGKLLTGSYGTLGLVTEAAFRLHPFPPARLFVTAQLPDARSAGGAVAAVVGSQVVASAVEVDQPGTGPLEVAVLLEGTEVGVSARAAVVQKLLGDGVVGLEPPTWFARYPFEPDGVGLKLTTEIGSLAVLLDVVRRAAERHEVLVQIRGSACGVLCAGMPATTQPARAAGFVHDLRLAATSYSGSVVVLTAPTGVRTAVDMWGPVAGLDLMRRVKHQLDPHHRLAPGRFVGGI